MLGTLHPMYFYPPPPPFPKKPPKIYPCCIQQIYTCMMSDLNFMEL